MSTCMCHLWNVIYGSTDTKLYYLISSFCFFSFVLRDEVERNLYECILSDWVVTPWPVGSCSAALNKVL